jgi:3-deoxy-D-manno-octulosonate 8-phosphate phosphatase (KDO 8-P phosphatase)
MRVPDLLVERLNQVKLFLCDVDGVLTDSRVFMGTGGVEVKAFHIRDGLGLRLLQGEGIQVGWVSARPSPATTERANDLKIDFLQQSSTPKVTLIQDLLARAKVRWEETLYMGDDVVDLAALRLAGFAAVPADGIEEARAIAHYVCRAPGGMGAVREVVDLVLKAQGRWEGVLQKFAS